MLEMLSYNPLLIVAGAIISLEIFVLMTMFLVFLVGYSFDTVINDPRGHYATAKNSVSIAKTKSGELGYTLMQVRTDLVRNASSFDYLKAVSKAGDGISKAGSGISKAAGDGIYKVLKEVKPAKAVEEAVRIEMPTAGMRILSQREVKAIPSNIKQAIVRESEQPKNGVYLPPIPQHKPFTSKSNVMKK